MSFTLDPEVGAVLAAALESDGAPPTPAAGDVDARRNALNPMLEYVNNQAQARSSDVETSDHEIRAADGTTLLARWYRRSVSGSGAAALYLHGGGMILGSVPIFDGPVSRYVARSGVAMLSVEYRLAPEHPHPTPVEDAYAGLLWLAEHAEQLGVDPTRLAVMGDSAGGGLAAGVAILARDRNGPPLRHQLLIYPMLDDRTTSPDPHVPRSPAGPTTTTSPAGMPCSEQDTNTATSTPTPRPPGSPTRVASRRPTSRSASSTSSATRTSGTP